MVLKSFPVVYFLIQNNFHTGFIPKNSSDFCICFLCEERIKPLLETQPMENRLWILPTLTDPTKCVKRHISLEIVSETVIHLIIFGYKD